MADIYTSFHQFQQHSIKRKRHIDEHNDSLFGRDVKRRSTHVLPIRLSPARPQIHVPATTYSPLTCIYQQPPTPVDTSEDESLDGPEDASSWPVKAPATHPSDAQPSKNSSISSLKGQPGVMTDTDMDLCTPSSSSSSLFMPRIRRARSNDIIPPHRDPSLLSAIDSIGRDRVPTPINSHFDNRLSDLPSVPRHQFPPLRTNLSPMFEQESWITRDGLPSPVEDQDMEGMMMVDSTNDLMGGLRVDGCYDQFAGAGQAKADSNSSPSRSRPARLHMGFLNGCDKCIQRVPGHYSHILRS
ncbi:hypothetical protein B0A52_09292 [Exophiala mesophila]|uniref:Uncharacterized protein n=1 Tax=Exophiala mesophila TaxID=212818 RepID=A0A438MU44_EXOME|nr:hypothetical protein B0A52_09292 [Exophiala mesophila]